MKNWWLGTETDWSTETGWCGSEIGWSEMGSGDFSLSRGGFGTGVPGNKALKMCVYDGGGREGGKGERGEMGKGGKGGKWGRGEGKEREKREGEKEKGRRRK